MKIIIVLFALTLSGVLQGANNLIENSEFSSSVNGRIKRWTLRGKNIKCSVNGKEMNLANGMLIQNGLKLKPGTTYDVNYSYKGNGEAKVRVYVEWNIMKDGKRIGGHSHGTTFRNTTHNWQEYSYSFSFPAGVDPAYIVVQASGGASFKNISLTPRVEAHALGGTWRCYGKSHASGQGVTISDGSHAILEKLKLKRGRRYELSFDAVGQGASGLTTGYHSFRVWVRFAKLTNYIRSRVIEAYSDNVQHKSVFFSVPDDKEYGGLTSLDFRVSPKCNLKFSNFKLSEAKIPLKEKYNIELSSPVYRNSIFSSMPVNTISGSIAVEPKIKTLTLTFNGKPISVHREGGKAVFSIPAVDLPDGKYVIEANLITDSGKTIKRQCDIDKYPPSPGEVTQDANRHLYVDGKPFFPILFYHIYSEKFMRYALMRGVNTAMVSFHFPTEERLLETLDQAGVAGIKLMISIDLPPASKPESEYIRWHKCVEKIITSRFRKHPALLGYYLSDEPGWGGIPLPVITKAYEKLKSLDPYHPVWTCEAPRGTEDSLKAYAKATDIYGFDIYSFPYPTGHSGMADKMPTCVGKYTSLARKVTNDQKAVMMVLQGFSWDDYHKRPNPAYPKLSDLRFTVYDALVNGTSAIGFWGIHYVYRPDFFDTLFALSKELHAIVPFFGPGGKCTPVRSNLSGIKLYLLQKGDLKILLAMNVTDKKIKGELEFTEFGNTNCNVYFENREIPVKAGHFQDEFNPYTVHLYSTAKMPKSYFLLSEGDSENPFKKLTLERIERRKNKQK